MNFKIGDKLVWSYEKTIYTVVDVDLTRSAQVNLSWFSPGHNETKDIWVYKVEDIDYIISLGVVYIVDDLNIKKRKNNFNFVSANNHQ